MSSRRAPLVAAVVAVGLVAGCSGDDTADDGRSSAELPEPAPGPVPELEVAAPSALASPLPDVAVRRLNGDGGWVQFKNELPAEQPLLVWFWAPF